VNAEQMAVAARDLRGALQDGRVTEFLESKDGITDDVVRAFQQVRDSFDAAGGQSGLSDFR